MSESTTEDELLDELGRHLREREAEREEAWLPVMLGERDADAVAAERAAAGDSAEDIELARLLYAPDDPARREAAVAAAVAGDSDDSGDGEGGEAKAPIRVVEPAANDRGPWLWLAALAVAAAVIVFVIVWPRGPGSDDAPQLAALPAYTLDAGHGLATQRGDPPPADDRLRYRASTRVQWSLRPPDEVLGALECRIFARSSSGELRRLELGDALTLWPTGAASVDAPASALGLEPGDWTVIWIVARPGAMPSEETVGSARTAEGVHVERFVIRIEAG